MKSMLKKIKQRITEASRTITDEFYVGQDKKARVRFLTDLEDALEVTWHDKYEDGINTPCHSHFGLNCPFCGLDKGKVRTRQIFAWTIYNFDTDKKQIFRYPANNFSPIPSLVAMYESYGTICDRDFVITRTGTGFEVSYQVVPMDKSTFKGDSKPFSKEAICKKWAKMYDIKGVQEEAEKNKIGKAKVEEKVGEKTEENDAESFTFSFDEEEKHEDNTLGELFELQKKLQMRFYDDASELPKEMPEKIPMQITSLIAELGEILEENQRWKSWRKNPPPVNYENLLIEVVDAFHFLINIALFLGFDSNDIYNGFIKKNKRNIERQDNNY